MSREEFIQKLIKHQIIDTLTYRYLARPTITYSLTSGKSAYIVTRISIEDLRKRNHNWETVGTFDADGKCISE